MYIVGWIGDNMEKVLDVLIFIITIPFKIFKYANLAFYYLIKLIAKETPEKREAREAKEREREAALEKEKEKAQEYLKENKDTILKFGNDNNPEVIHKDKVLSKEEQREEHRLAKEKIRREKLKQKEEERREHKNLFAQIKKKSIFTKRQEQKRKILSMDETAKEAKRSNEKVIFRYTAKSPSGVIEKGKFQGYSKLDVHSYLLAEGYEVYEITAQSKATVFNTDIGLNRTMKKSTLVFYLTQLSTYLKAGIPIVDSIKLLTGQAKSRTEKTIWKSVVYELTMGATLSDAMYRCGNNVFPKLLINMVKTAEMTGDLPDVLDEQVEYYKATEKSRKEMINALMYPLFVFIFAVIIVFYIMISVVPQFVNIYDSINAELPGITTFMINASNFIRDNILWILGITVLVIILFILAYKRSVLFKASVQRLLMHFPVIGNVYYR